ncbi:DUF58 domain-containing protein [Nocardioides sp. CFH 31398]|uniref:DUF58 domain-containing protein n=1 Tax=Nocardioides sp. CFH 31398 TaxID=2919579 RepID=UPI001F069B32|nr:DUF58 domain-containing protein [Nocardioides sp. CFH 31398]MCH1868267.1 DUF58 domain-containing protein [Nocardioides sp. CFH 31398]
MREALAGLTVRGRAFVAAGTTAVVCAVVLGQSALVRVGVLVALLPLLAAFVIGRSRYRLTLERTLSPATVTVGEPARVDLLLVNEGRTPTGVLLLEDHVPHALGSRPRFVLEGIGHGWRRHVSYPVRPGVRGRYPVGPMDVRVSDPFGLVEVGRSFRSEASLVVVPAVVPLAPIGLGGQWTGAGDERPRSFATGSAEDVTVRDYRVGDDLRRVHWRSSARTGELMVRREEQPWQPRATVMVDDRARAHRGQGAASSLELAVGAAASVAVHLTRRGYLVRLVTASGEHPTAGWHDRVGGVADSTALLEALAVLTPTSRIDLDTSWLTDAARGGILVAVLGGSEPGDAANLRRMRHHAGTAIALPVDLSGWASAGSAPPAVTTAAVVAGQGWRMAELRPSEPLDVSWSRLAHPAAAGAPVAAPATGDPVAGAAR